MMVRLGFSNKWIKWILGYLRFATVSILVNSSPTSEFILGKEVRQGDPLAPFLFLIVDEGLAMDVKKSGEQRYFRRNEGRELGN